MDYEINLTQPVYEIEMNVPSGGVPSIRGTQNQVLVNGGYGSNVSAAATLTTPQDIAPTSAVTFASVTATTFTGNLVGNASTATTAGAWTTARNLAGNSVNGSANVAFANKFIVQGTTDAGLSGAQFLGALGTGIVKNTTTTGVLSIAVAADFPTLNQNTTGSAATLTTPRAINGVNFDGSAAITVTAAAGTLTGTTLNATVVASSLTSLGTITTFQANTIGAGGAQNGSNIVSIYNSGGYNSEGNNALRILSSVSSIDTGMQIGVDTTLHASYIQAMQPLVSFATRPLLLQPAGGYVGVGVTAPSVHFHIQDTSQDTIGFRVGSSGIYLTANGYQIGSVGYNLRLQSDTSYDVILQPNSRSVGIGTSSPGAKLHVYGGGNIGQIIESTNVSYLNFYDGVTYANINTYHDGTLRFQSSTSSYNSGAVQMVMLPSGYVGFGTATPKNVVHVAGGIQAAGTPDVTAGNGAALYMGYNGGAVMYAINPGSAYTAFNTFSDTFQINTNGTTSAVFVDAAQFVGIGTASPEGKLDVRWATTASIVRIGRAGWAFRFGELQNGRQFIGQGVTKTGADNNYIAKTGSNAAVSHLAFEYDYTNTTGGFNFLGQNYAGADGTTLSLASLMHVGVDGKVGIGTASPGRSLEIYNAYPVVRYNRNAAYIWEAGVGDGAAFGIPLSYFGIRDVSAATIPFVIAHTTGYVGIGTTAPSTLFSVGTSSQFQVDGNGYLGIGGRAVGTNPVSIQDSASDKGILMREAGGNNFLRIAFTSAYKVYIDSSTADLVFTLGGSGKLTISTALVSTNQAFTASGLITGSSGLTITGAGSFSTALSVGDVPNAGYATSFSSSKTANVPAIYGIQYASGGTIIGSNSGVRGEAYVQTGTDYGVGIYGTSTGPRGGGTNIGGYFTASGAGTNYALITGAGNAGFLTDTPTAVVHIHSDILRLDTAKTPASAAASGNTGDVCWDSSYVYVCVAASTWKRAAIATW